VETKGRQARKEHFRAWSSGGSCIRSLLDLLVSGRRPNKPTRTNVTAFKFQGGTRGNAFSNLVCLPTATRNRCVGWLGSREMETTIAPRKVSTFCCMKWHLNEANVFFFSFELIFCVVSVTLDFDFLLTVVRIKSFKNSTIRRESLSQFSAEV
jgi:hypothetical protein